MAAAYWPMSAANYRANLQDRALARGLPRMSSFSARLISWQEHAGRRDLPWQNTRDAYRIWISEIMLQQTQVATVMPYYQRFLDVFPDVQSLAAASIDAVLQLWSGLGYYRRAHLLHRAAQEIVGRHGGAFPRDAATLATLPGIGRSTAAAIAAFAYGERGAILDGNVKRVLARHQGVEGHAGDPAVLRALWARAEDLLPRAGIEPYTQALMDLGAMVCLRSTPDCARCPVAADCVARLRESHRRAASHAPSTTAAAARNRRSADRARRRDSARAKASDRYLGRALEPSGSRVRHRCRGILPRSLRRRGRGG